MAETAAHLVDHVFPPLPRAHRHRYYGVLAPNARLRAAVTAQAHVAVAPAPTSAATREELRHRAVARYLWAALHAQQDGAGQDPARIAPARGPPLWEAAAAEQARNDPQWGSSAQSDDAFVKRYQ